MNRIIKTVVLSGTAAAAMMGAAATASAASPEAATASIEAQIDRAAGAPVSLPDGRTLHVRGLDSVSYRADAGHRTAVVQLASGTEPGGTSGIDNSVGTNPQQTGTGQGVGYNPQQIRTQSGAGVSLGASAVLALVLAVVMFFGIKHNHLSKGWALVSVSMGVVMAGTVVGTLVTNLGGSGINAFSNIFSGM